MMGIYLMFSASAGYHLTQAGPKFLQILRKLDHTAIYLLIAGTNGHNLRLEVSLYDREVAFLC